MISRLLKAVNRSISPALSFYYYFTSSFFNLNIINNIRLLACLLGCSSHARTHAIMVAKRAGKHCTHRAHFHFIFINKALNHIKSIVHTYLLLSLQYTYVYMQLYSFTQLNSILKVKSLFGRKYNLFWASHVYIIGKKLYSIESNRK